MGMGSTYFGQERSSIPHLERADEIVSDLRSDVEEAMVLIEAQLGAVEQTLDNPTALGSNPTRGTRYLVGTGAGVFAGEDGHVAVKQATSTWTSATDWAFLTPTDGDLLVDKNTDSLLYSDGTNWIVLASGASAWVLGNIKIGDASTPSVPVNVDMTAIGSILAGDGTTASAVTIGTAGDFLVGDAAQAVAVNLAAGEMFVGDGATATVAPVGGTAGGLPIGDGAAAVAVAAPSGVVEMDSSGVTTFDQANLGEQKSTYTAYVEWDVGAGAAAGGATYNFQNATTDAQLPDDAVITNIRLDCITAFTSGGTPTIEIGIEAANDVKTVTAFNAAPFDGTLSLEVVAIKTTAAQNIVATVNGASPANDLTGGKIVALIEYFVTQP